MASRCGELAKLDWEEIWMTWFQRTRVRLMGPIPGYVSELPPGTRIADPFGICVAPDDAAVEAWGFEVGHERTPQ
jgi:hypothetical protein